MLGLDGPLAQLNDQLRSLVVSIFVASNLETSIHQRTSHGNLFSWSCARIWGLSRSFAVSARNLFFFSGVVESFFHPELFLNMTRFEESIQSGEPTTMDAKRFELN